MLPLHVVIIPECTPALHSRYFLVAASMLCSIVRSLSCRACVPSIDLTFIVHLSTFVKIVVNDFFVSDEIEYIPF
jgi:hypothetical protein